MQRRIQRSSLRPARDRAFRRLRRSSRPARANSAAAYEDYIERGPGSDLGDFTGMRAE